MSQENVELLHQVNDAFNRRDLDAFVALNHAEVGWRAGKMTWWYICASESEALEAAGLRE